ncbi:MAG: hypothetical protein K6G10_12990 [Butyrivibrio sp.]|nr:hypothetical protein [Butyrivibrio sp.]
MRSITDTEFKYKDMLQAFLNIQVIGQTSINFLNERKLAKEMKKYAGLFNEAGEEALKGFSKDFVEMCLSSKSYGTTFFGTIHMSDGGAASRLATDIDDVTGNIPGRFGLADEYRPLRSALFDAYLSEIKEGSRLLSELGINV